MSYATDLRDQLCEHFIFWNMRGKWECECGSKFALSEDAIDHQSERIVSALGLDLA